MIVLLAGGILLLAGKALLAFESSREQQVPPRGPSESPRSLMRLTRLEAVSYAVAEGVIVRGWYAPARSGAAVLFVHGQPGTRADLLPEAEALVQAGYGALLVDLPGHGESDGQARWGAVARDAVVRGLDFLAERCDVESDRLGVFGFSYGSSLVAHVAANEPRIQALVLAGVVTSARAQIEYAYSSLGPLTAWPAIWGAEYHGLDLESLQPIDVIASIAPVPTLFITGSADVVVPRAMTLQVFERAGEPKELLSVEGAGHGNYAQVLEERYFTHLLRFFDRYLGSQPQRMRSPAPKRRAPCAGPGKPVHPT